MTICTDSVQIKEQRLQYLAGLKRLKNKGVSIFVDGIECPEKEWGRIFEVGEDGGFYMGDYVCLEQGYVKEVRFDRVYLSEPPSRKK